MSRVTRSQAVNAVEQRWVEMLPVQLKVEIFSYLSLHDRETVRLVCRDWYNVSWSRKLIVNDWVKLDESFGCVKLDEILALSEDARRERPMSVAKQMKLMGNVFSAEGCGKPVNFRLLGTQQPVKAGEPFWKVFGAGIVHLELTSLAKPQVLLMILENCTSLQHLDIVELSLPKSISDASKAAIRENLSGLRTLSLSEYPSDALNDLIPARLDKISVGNCNICHCDEKKFEEMLARQQVKEFSVHIPIDQSSSTEAVTRMLSDTRLLQYLVEFELSFDSLKFDLDLSIDFRALSQHNNTLKVLKLDLCTGQGSEATFHESILQTVRSLSNLEKVSVALPESRASRMVHAILTSNPDVQELTIVGLGRSFDYDMPEKPNYDYLQTVGASLKSLRIEQLSLTGILFSKQKLVAFAGHLTTLELDCAAEYLPTTKMQLICKECMLLTTLKIKRNRDASGRFLCKAVHLRLSNLTHLQTLQLHGGFGATTVKQIQHLRHLELGLWRLSDSDLVHVAESNPLLKAFDFDYVGRSKQNGNKRDHGALQVTWNGIWRFLELCPCLVSLGTYETVTKGQMKNIMNTFPRLKRLNGNLLVTDE